MATASRSSVEWHTFDARSVDADLVTIVRATCLLESRSSQYQDYLAGVLPARFEDDVVAWAAEEEHHGRALRRWLERADPTFDVDRALRQFAELPYHHGGAGGRGGPTHELIARCVVEALASAYYLALATQTEEPLLRQLCVRLSADEHRHFERFLAMTTATPPLGRAGRARVAVRRMLDLEDDQIVFAAHVARGGGPYDRTAVRRRHLASVYDMHDTGELDHAQQLIWRAIGLSVPGPVQRSFTVCLRSVLRIRSALWRRLP